jgi:hypothetical protein
MGALIVSASNSVIEHRKRYDDISACKAKRDGNCYVDFDISEHMDADVFFYYEIDNMYQSHRLYANSLSVEQMLGHDESKSSIKKTCDPVIKIKDLDNPYKNSPLGKNAIANPCGLIAKSFFNDEFNLFEKKSLKDIHINQHNIAMYSDRENKFKNSSSVDHKRWINIKNGKN